MLALAAQEADIVGLQMTSPAGGALAEEPTLRLAETVMEKITALRRAAGARFRDIELSAVASVIIADHPRGAAEDFARHRGWSGVPADTVLEMPSVFIGSRDRIVETMQKRRERYGFSYYVVPAGAIEDCAPIVTHLAGR